VLFHDAILSAEIHGIEGCCQKLTLCDTATAGLRKGTFCLKSFRQSTVNFLLIYFSYFSCILANGLYHDVILIAEICSVSFCCYKFV
jgi:hypothetical protein